MLGGGGEGVSSQIVHVNCKLLGSALISLITFPNFWITPAEKVVSTTKEMHENKLRVSAPKLHWFYEN